MREWVAPVCSPAFLTDHPISAAGDLLKLPLLHMASRPGAWTHWFESLGIIAGATERGMRFEQFSNVAQACIAGLGVALMPLFLIKSELDSRQLVTAVDHQVQSPSAYYFVAPVSKQSHRPVAAFKTWLLSEMKAQMA
jgi:LysR family glycine cleavage system transcriptional activator